ncbi:uncharacterized protein LOC119068946 [Bradysia coprophila]|uniref:uncharacterized protein LOC119068946 n=1 Tax=Bradysia coprophila TaxID=38358 RepID=UPI00187DA8E5|nr:uncharacterized protein LOC119068946 [Bradysia coprophila]
MVFVYVTELLITVYRVMTVYIIQFYYRDHFRNLLTEALHLHQRVSELMNGAWIFNKTFYRCYTSKVTGVVFQFAIISYLISLYKQMASAIFNCDLLTFSMFIYIHFTAITMSSVFYAGMMFVLLIFQNLNRKASQLSNSIKDTELKIRMKCELCGRLCDEVDQIVYIYERAVTFLKNFNRFFSFQLLFTFINAIYVVLVELYYIYDNVRQMSSDPDSMEFLYGHIVKDLAYMLCFAIEFFHIVLISSTVTEVALQTGMAFRAHFNIVDSRLKQSIELLTLQNLLISPTVMAGGLIEIKTTILFAVGSWSLY